MDFNQIQHLAKTPHTPTPLNITCNIYTIILLYIVICYLSNICPYRTSVTHLRVINH